MSDLSDAQGPFKLQVDLRSQWSASHVGLVIRLVSVSSALLDNSSDYSMHRSIEVFLKACPTFILASHNASLCDTQDNDFQLQRFKFKLKKLLLHLTIRDARDKTSGNMNVGELRLCQMFTFLGSNLFPLFINCKSRQAPTENLVIINAYRSPTQ